MSAASIGFHGAVDLQYRNREGSRWFWMVDPNNINVHVAVHMDTAGQHRTLANQLRAMADDLDAAADELDVIENPCPDCAGLGEVNPSWNGDPQMARDCRSCGATGVAS